MDETRVSAIADHFRVHENLEFCIISWGLRGAEISLKNVSRKPFSLGHGDYGHRTEQNLTNISSHCDSPAK